MTIPDNIENQRKIKLGGKFSPIGMLLTFILGSVSAIIIGLIIYGVEVFINFSIPLLFPMLAGVAVGLITKQLGSTIGRCRNQVLAISVGAMCAFVAWGTPHVADYINFRIGIASYIHTEAPQMPPEQISYVIDQWLIEQTGQDGVIGFFMLKASAVDLEIQGVVSGAAVPPFRISGIGLVFYWLFELVLMVVMAGIANFTYPKGRYCETCHAWRMYKSPKVGTDQELERVIEYLRVGNITLACELLEEHEEGHITRLEIEYCPVCYDSDFARLVVAKDTGPNTWAEQTVWVGKIEPEKVKLLVAT